MRLLAAVLLAAALSLAGTVPAAPAAERGIVYSKVKEPLEADAEGNYGPPVGGLYTLHGKHPFRVTYDPADGEPSVSAAGTIAFVRGGDVYLVRPDGTGLRRLTGGPEIDEGPLFAPDGRSLVFSRRSAEGAARDLYRIALDGSPPVALTATPADESEAAFSPGGAEVAYAAEGDLYSVKPAGGVPRRLTRTPEKESGPRYFVAGILFNRTRPARPRTPGIYRMRRDGSRVAPVVQTKAGARISGVTPDGRLLAFASRGGYWSEWLAGPERAAPRKLSGINGGDELAISPDGRHGAFLLYFDEDFAIEALNLRSGGFDFSADLYREGDGIAIDRDLAW